MVQFENKYIGEYMIKILESTFILLVYVGGQ
jgi:hypothetical protein